MLNSDLEPAWQVLEKYHTEFLAEIRKLYAIKHDRNKAYEHLANLYRYLKEITPSVYVMSEKYKIYNSMLNLLLKAEEEIFGDQIIDVYPDFKYDKRHRLDHKLDHYSSSEELLDELVYSTRKKLVTSWGKISDLNTLNLGNKCRTASGILYRNAKSMGIDVKRIIIHPGYSEKSYLYNGDGFHYFNLVTIDGKEYIVDCSYAQFFYRGRNNLERLGIVDLSGCYPGVYMLQNEQRESVATAILKRGWCEATEENMKAYLDGFTLMYRNGLYYENLGEAIYEVDYTIDQYMNFLYGDDNQVKHEGREFLGYQRKQLNNPSFVFKK